MPPATAAPATCGPTPRPASWASSRSSTDPLAWKGKGELTKLFQDLHAFSDSLDLCKFSAFAEGADEYAAQYSAMVGIPFTADDVLDTGERIYNLERYYNNLAGFREGSDYLPSASSPSRRRCRALKATSASWT
jgi:aldehyde:ferredoxin oxidoreductase